VGEPGLSHATVEYECMNHAIYDLEYRIGSKVRDL
jgi:hypothetical protein